ncbi:MAG: cell division protein FtsA [Brevundimonas sp.]|uniref:cell division protein FtsA n=1 Tax=Brevundimonas sp. TaxID=1871086 RepID=UPI001A315B59|nr:cell division protein FtsA [Brevundimonas sp.]MBJ7447060.1 cell division protein FtsA [Brevundimonas sp.]
MDRPDRKAIAAAWLDARWSALTLRQRRDVEARQARLWRRMQPVVAATPAIAHLAGQPLDRFPIMQPRELRAGFVDWNTLGLTRDRAEAAARDAEAGSEGLVAPGVAAGFSTGSSGTPGLFLNSRAERAAYLGHLLARLLTVGDLFSPLRIALCLRADNRLYQDVGRTGRIRFLFVSLGEDPAARFQRLQAFRPDILIGPPHVLAELARRTQSHDQAWSLRRLFYGAEPMGKAERGWIGSVLGARPDPLYQATEGFIAAPCRHGTLHLNEDVLNIEREPVPGTDRFVPVVTDLRRTSQPMIRVRLGDLLQPLEGRCVCGSPLTATHPVEGRLEDLWRWPGGVIPPRVVETTISKAVGPDIDWRATASREGVVVEAEGLLADAAAEAVTQLLAAHNIDLPVTSLPQVPVHGIKRRRIRWSDG